MATDLNDPSTPAEMTSDQHHLDPEWRSDLPEVCTLLSTPSEGPDPLAQRFGESLVELVEKADPGRSLYLEEFLSAPRSMMSPQEVEAFRRMAPAESNPAATASPVITDVNAVLQERGNRYGPFVGHAEITIRLKAVIHEELNKRGKELKEDQIEALHMITHKIGRIINGDPDYVDNWVDIAGYAGLVQKRLEGEIL